MWLMKLTAMCLLVKWKKQSREQKPWNREQKQQNLAQQHGEMESKQAGMPFECTVTFFRYYTVAHAKRHMGKHRKTVKNITAWNTLEDCHP